MFELKALLKEFTIMGPQSERQCYIPVNGDSTKRILQVTSRCYILADWILCIGNLRNDKKESKERHMSERAVCEGYVQSHDAGGMAV